MSPLQPRPKKYAFILWCLIFMLAYVCYAYYITHCVLSIAYVRYLTFSMNLVAKGVVVYLLGSFAFFMVCILIEACFSTTLLLLLRKWMIRRCINAVDSSNVYQFANICNLLLNFFIAVGFVFLLGIKDNFFEMFYLLFETATEESLTVQRMAYDVEINWVFCDLLVFKMIFESIFKKEILDEKLHPQTVYFVPTEEESSEV